MEKHRVNTTISAKHWEILKKHAAKYESQQKTIEIALENLENTELPGKKLSLQEQYWLRSEKLNIICLIHRDIFYELFRSADCEQLNELLEKQNMVEYMLIMYYNKPLKECCFKEVMDGIVAINNATKSFDSTNYSENEIYYTIKITHSARTMNYSKSINILFETFFNAHGIKTQSEVSNSSIFIKLYKNFESATINDKFP
jgi:hypothetical protein